LYRFALCAAAGAALASLSGCVARTIHRNGVTVTVNGINASGVVGSNSATESVQKRFQAGSVSSLKADTDYGSIEIIPMESGKDEIHVQATKTVHGSDPSDKLKTLLSSVTIQADLVNGALVLTSTHPADFNNQNISVSIDYVLTVPPRLALALRTGSGAISVNGALGGGKLHSDYGDIKMKDVGGALDVSTSSGSISVERAANAIVAKSSYGNITLNNISGDIDADTQSGTISVHSVDKASTVKLHSGYGNVSLDGGCGTVDASSTSGVVTLNDCRITNHLKLHSDYGNVEATNVTSQQPELNAELTTQSGSATFNGEASDLMLHSDYGSVNGELGAALPLRTATLRSSSGSVSLTLPATASARVNASTSSGTVDLGNGDNGSSGSLTLGSGAAQVNLESSYGNVVLRTK
jgi:hypothetical protein